MSPRVSFDELAKQNVARLLKYATQRLYLDDADYFYAQNQLLDALKIAEPGEYDDIEVGDIYDVVEALSAYAVRKKLIDENQRLLFETRLIGYCMPAPSAVVSTFDDVASYEGVDKACDYLHKLGIDSLYLRQKDFDKNIIWKHDAPRGDIVVTINLSKPEKTPEQVRLAKEAKTGYPKCALCEENLGFVGNAAMSARQTIRTIPFELDGEDWFMQFSPYSYFEQHVIAVCKKHRPMCVSDATLKRMLDFVDLFPHYFIGSNAALPIVGGSILAHDHYQGGKKVLPVFTRPARRYFRVDGYGDVNVSVVDWYNSIVRIESANRDHALEIANKFRRAWDDYSDESVNVICSTQKDGERVQHNAVTPIASINSDGEYQFNLILRNNRTDEQHPFGIFHPAKELHNIKQESIGIIEVMGLFILPGRLAKECEMIRDILTGATVLDFKALAEETHPLNKHLGMITQLVVDNGTACAKDKAEAAVTDYINNACEKILDTTAVFKNDEVGQQAFDKFIASVIGNAE
ncbi:MAG: galactose-1-phosphate uridylyltransferase [Christensenellales bacterium]